METLIALLVYMVLSEYCDYTDRQRRLKFFEKEKHEREHRRD